MMAQKARIFGAVMKVGLVRKFNYPMMMSNFNTSRVTQTEYLLKGDDISVVGKC